MHLETPASDHHVVAPDEGDVTLALPSTRSQYQSLARWTALTDAVGVLAGFSVAYLVRFQSFPPRGERLGVTLVAPVVWLVLLAAYRTYDVSRLAGAEQFRRLVTTTTVGITLIVTLSFWWRQSFSRLWIALAWLFVLMFLVIGRRMWDGWVELRRRDGEFVYATLVVGTDRDATKLGEALGRGRHGFRVIGYVATSAARPANVNVLGSVEDLAEIFDRVPVESVFVSPAALSTAQMHDVIRLARRRDLDVRLTANLPEIISNRVAPIPVAGMTTLSVRPVHLTGPQTVAKRTIDVVGASLGMILLSPLFLAIAVAIKVTSRGPLLYGHVRVGRHGERFAMLKFRTMVRDADRMRDNLVHLNEASGPLFKIRSDPRITRVGRFLRHWSLDELPQLMNVLVGDMSLVGPRPSLPSEVETYTDWHRNRLEVKPGITGLWQVSGRADLAFDDYVRLDLYYIENWSLAYDLFILLKTIPTVVSARGSF